MTIIKLFTLGVLALWPLSLQAAEEARLMERWLVSDSLSERVVDHSAWQGLLDRYLIEVPNGTRFDYAGVTPEDLDALDGYLQRLSQTDVDRLNMDEQMAFWINAYNALVVRIVLSEYPVASINDIGGGWFSSGPWDEKRFRVYLIDLSLNDIYHRILRPIWTDNRVHYGLACGGNSCPDLMPKAFMGATVKDDLAIAATNFINGPKAVLQVNGNGVRLSRIYDWYREDFGDSPESVLEHLKSFANQETEANLQNVTTINGHAFDWSLNDRPGNR